MPVPHHKPKDPTKQISPRPSSVLSSKPALPNWARKLPLLRCSPKRKNGLGHFCLAACPRICLTRNPAATAAIFPSTRRRFPTTRLFRQATALCPRQKSTQLPQFLGRKTHLPGSGPIANRAPGKPVAMGQTAAFPLFAQASGFAPRLIRSACATNVSPFAVGHNAKHRAFSSNRLA